MTLLESTKVSEQSDSEQNEYVTVRCLPEGPMQSCRLQKLAGRRLKLGFASEDSPAMRLGSLVEVTSAARVYLGEVRGISKGIVSIHVEHAIELQALAALEQKWRLPSKS